MREKDIKVLSEELKKLLRKQNSIVIRAPRFEVSKRSNIVSFAVQGSQSLSSLQLLGLWKGETLKEARKYGRPFRFDPYFTMGVMRRREDTLTVEKNMQGVRFQFAANEIYICEVNRWWQVTRMIKKITFGKSYK